MEIDASPIWIGADNEKVAISVGRKQTLWRSKESMHFLQIGDVRCDVT
jgi:hypothetical protein